MGSRSILNRKRLSVIIVTTARALQTPEPIPMLMKNAALRSLFKCCGQQCIRKIIFCSIICILLKAIDEKKNNIQLKVSMNFYFNCM